MTEAVTDEGFLLALLNSTPVVGGVPTDSFADTAQARAWQLDAGGTGTKNELRQLLEVREALQAVVRGEQTPGILASALRGTSYVPSITGAQVDWALTTAPDRELAVRAILAWDSLAKRSPGRLRPCANGECRLFLIDRTKGNTTRWCSMAACGNRMKARRHYQRARGPQPN